jgi:hypothetical protein
MPEFLKNTADVFLPAIGITYGVLFLAILVGLVHPSKVVVATVRLAFVMTCIVLLVTIIWGLSSMAFIYMSGGSFK